MNAPLNQGRTGSRILDILILQDMTLFCALEAGDIVCWLVNPSIAKLDLFKSTVCRWIIQLTQSISFKFQQQSADLYKVQLCNRQFFVVSTAVYVVKVYTSVTQGRLFFYYSPQMLGNNFQLWGRISSFLEKKKEKKIQSNNIDK